MTLAFKFLSLFALIFSISTYALEEISDESLARVTGQNGVNLSGELNLNENGGPLTSSDAGNAGVWGTCTEKQASTVERCGARLAVQSSENGGWIALDEMKGKLSFEGLTLRSRVIDGTADDWDGLI